MRWRLFTSSAIRSDTAYIIYFFKNGKSLGELRQRGKIHRVGTVSAIAAWKDIVLSSTFCANTICMKVVKFGSQTALQWWFLIIVRVIFKTTKWKVSQNFSSGLFKERDFPAVYSRQVGNWMQSTSTLPSSAFSTGRTTWVWSWICKTSSVVVAVPLIFSTLCYCSLHSSHLCCWNSLPHHFVLLLNFSVLFSGTLWWYHSWATLFR